LCLWLWLWLWQGEGLSTLGIEVEKQGFQRAWLITDQKFQKVGLKLKAFILTFRDLSSHENGLLVRFEVWEFFPGLETN